MLCNLAVCFAILNNTTVGDTLSVHSAGIRLQDTSSIRRLPRMTVQADAHREYGSTALSLRAEDFQRLHSSLPSVLETIGGVAVHRTGGIGGYAEASIRGSGSQQVQVVVDGVPLNSASGGAADLGKIPLGSIRNLTVYRATVPLEYFASNAGGVIEIETRPRDDITSMHGEFGSYLYRNAGALHRRKFGQGYLAGSIDYTGGKNDYLYYYTPTRSTEDILVRKKNNHFDIVAGTFRLSQSSQTTTVTGSAQLSWYRHGIFGGGDPWTPVQSYTTGTRGLLSLECSHQFTEKMFLSTDLKGRMFHRGLIDPDSSFYIPIQKDLSDRFPYGALSSKLTYKFDPHVTTRILAIGEYERFSSRDDLHPSANHARASRSAFAAGGEISGTWTKLNSGIQFVYRYQYDRNENIEAFTFASDTLASASVHYPSLQAWLNARPHESIALFCNGKYSHRPPGFQEKFGLGPGYVGNPKLKPETRMEVSIGTEFVPRKDFSCVLSTFYGITNDKIITSIQAQRIFVSRNFRRITHCGLEFEFASDPWKFLNLANNFGFGLHVISDHPNEELIGAREPLQPAWKNSTRITLHTGPISAGHSILVTGPYFKTEYDRKPQEALIDAGVHFSLRPASGLSCTFRVDNYLNQMNYDHYGFPHPGRTFYAIMDYSL